MRWRSGNVSLIRVSYLFQPHSFAARLAAVVAHKAIANGKRSRSQGPKRDDGASLVRPQQRDGPLACQEGQPAEHGPPHRETRRTGDAGHPILIGAGENVLDLFGGSGSTLIACEQTSRKAFLMELDPLYCDVIVQRWEQFTGKQAQRQGAV